jgi:glycine cleavage system protein P-like pyridoxal-binding family
MTIKKYFQSRNETQRKIIIIPQSAHGTNPASAAKMGLEIKIV